MKTFYWQVKREFWENRGGFMWAPIVTGVVFLLLNVMAIVAAEVMTARHGIQIGGNNFRNLIEKASNHDLSQIGKALDLTMLSSMGLITIVLGFVVFFYCLGSLYDDRRDRSVLFWKSLPLSNTSTVLSKVVSAVVLAPVIAVVVGIAVGLAQLVIFALVLSFHGINLWELLTLAHPLRVVFELISSIPVYALWAAPTVGWLMFCSAWARSKPFLWAVAVPAVTGLMVSWFDVMGLFNQSSSWFWTHIVQRSLLGVFPASSVIFNADRMMVGVGDDDPLGVLSPLHSYTLFASPAMWIGLVCGLALIAGSVWFRRVRDDS